MNLFISDVSIIVADDLDIVLSCSTSLSGASPGCNSFGTCSAPDTLPLFPGLFLLGASLRLALAADAARACLSGTISLGAKLGDLQEVTPQHFVPRACFGSSKLLPAILCTHPTKNAAKLTL